MRIVIFAHSLVSCWNHGNAHFLRGVARALQVGGHQVRVIEPEDGWSRAGMLREHRPDPVAEFGRVFPDLSATTMQPDDDVAGLIDDADLVLVHEWNTPALVASVGAARRAGGRFVALFHDTHHRVISDPDAIRAFALSEYDGVLAFGEALAEVYRRWGWGGRVKVWHEAADTSLFHPPEVEGHREGLVWIGNFGDGERTAELEAFLLRPASTVGVSLDVYGVRYPDDALAMLARHDARYHGWLPNAAVPETFARHLATIHVPRRAYAESLPGIPTIRVFEALACGIPLLCAPWRDSENLFRPGTDFLMTRDGDEMVGRLRDVLHDNALRESLVRHGLATIRARHTCAHRATELIGIAESLGARATEVVA